MTRTDLPYGRMMIRTVGAVMLALAACRVSERAPEAGTAKAASSADSATRDALLESRVPRAAAGDSGWRYQQRVSADLDGDQAPEAIVLIADVALNAKGEPLWEDGHRWQVYVEEADGRRTYVYARFLPNGKLTAQLTQPDSGGMSRLLLLEQTPGSVALFEIEYAGPERVALRGRFDRAIDPARHFVGSPRP